MAAALALTLSLFVVSARPAGAQGPNLVFASPLRAAAIDLNGDGLYDVLRLNVSVNVAEGGLFVAYWTVATFNGTLVRALGTSANLSVGPGLLQEDFPGPFLYLAGINGTLRVTLAVTGCVPSSGGGMTCFNGPTSQTTTSAYIYLEFEHPPVALGSPIKDFGRDLNGDGLFDELVLDVPVVVEVAGVVGLSATIQSPNFAFFDGDNPRWLDAGNYTWEFTISSLRVATLGGAGQVEIDLSTPALPDLVQEHYSITSWNSAKFMVSAVSIPSAPSTELVDLNGNGQADDLLVHVPLRVHQEGDFLVGAEIRSLGIGAAPRIVHEAIGNTTVTLTISGILLNRSASVGPYAIDTSASLVGPGFFGGASTTITTPNYTSADFESAPVDVLRANLTPPSCSSYPYGCGSAMVLGPNGFFTTQALGPSRNGGSDLTLRLFPGSFFVYVSWIYATTWARAFEVNVTGSSSVVWNVPALSPVAFNSTVTFTAADAATVRFDYSAGNASSAVRFLADMFGNADGSADASELTAAYPELFEYAVPSVLSQGLEGMSVDDQAFSSGTPQITALGGTGPIASSAPVELSIEGSWSTGVPALPQGAHWYNLTLITGSPYFRPSYRITFPLGSRGNLTVTGSTNVTRLGPADWLVVPASTPGGSFPLEVTIRVSIPPQTPLDLVTLSAFLLLAAVVGVAAVAIWRRRRQSSLSSKPLEPKGPNS